MTGPCLGIFSLPSCRLLVAERQVSGIMETRGELQPFSTFFYLSGELLFHAGAAT